MKQAGSLKGKPNSSGIPGYRRSGEASVILREQQMESDMEELWMDGPAIVNEEEPRTKRIGML